MCWASSIVSTSAENIGESGLLIAILQKMIEGCRADWVVTKLETHQIRTPLDSTLGRTKTKPHKFAPPRTRCPCCEFQTTNTSALSTLRKPYLFRESTPPQAKDGELVVQAGCLVVEPSLTRFTDLWDVCCGDQQLMNRRGSSGNTSFPKTCP